MSNNVILEKNYLTISKKLSDIADKDEIKRKIVRLVIKQGNSVLMLKRAKSDHLSGLYELPGGGLNENEDIFSGAKRELYEETGLLIKDFFSKPDSFDFSAVSDNKKCRGYILNILPEKKEIVLNPHEHSEYKWVTINEIDNLDMLSNIRTVTKKILKENL
jgi:8-oxo-dGTP diphosphatase